MNPADTQTTTFEVAPDTTPIVTIRNVDKVYRIYDRPSDRLWLPLKNRVRRVLGLPPRPPHLFHALKGVNLSIARGETVGIIGRNGSGKSTLLQILVGTLQATTGSLDVHGRVSALLELGAGFNPEFTGRENVYLAGAIVGIDARQMRELLHVIEAFADIGEFIDQPVKTYSSGMYVRLAFATAIHVSPDILVVDEALAVGDVAFQTKCLTRIRKMQSDGVSIILVTHAMNSLIEYCDRAIYLRKGEVMMDGACRDVVKRYADDLVDAEGGTVITATDQNSEADAPSSPMAQTTETYATAEAAIKTTGPGSEIVSVKLCDELGKQRTTFTFGERLIIEVRIRVHHRIQMPCYGVQIKSVDDIALWAGTTQNMEIDMAPIDPGTYVCHWNLGLNFTGNRYVIAIGAGDLDSGEYHRHSRLPYAGHVDVIPMPHEGHGWLAPTPQFSLSNEVA